ncbi:MAG: tetraacyldisaccharide 4'-kinase [Gemmatimonadaceae bacterium]|nr:tetraacyldisaccharide 4'-kinase [Gemmatimonadaceae bacterium]
MAAALLDWLWYGTDRGARIARGALRPLSAVYGGVMRWRNAWYDVPTHVHAMPVPALSIGNLSVGGTGKTPVAAWCAAALQQRGGAPALVLRGYGDDEPMVHRHLNPTVPVITTSDRVAGAQLARRAGADVVVLDDAFQHRRAGRVRDVVLVSADRWHDALQVLPAGPWREPIVGLRRAHLLVITRKAVSLARARAVATAVQRVAPAVPQAIVALVADRLSAMDGTDGGAVGALAGTSVLAICGIGDPSSFRAQLAAAGAEVQLKHYPDHYGYSDRDIASLAAAAGDRRVVTTLKDAVKLAQRWPRTASPLWYVSQRVVVEDGGSALDGALAAVLDARATLPG